MINELKVISVVNVTNNAKTLVLEPMNGWRPEYEAGQFITLLFDTEFGEKRRSYSFSSAPLLNEQLSITVKKLDNGEISRYILNHAKPGDILKTSGISGLFVLPKNNEEINEYCFIAAGSGITPCFSLIKTILGTTAHKITLIYSNKTEQDALFYSDLKQLQEKYSNRFHIKFLFSNAAGVYNSRLSQWLLEQLLDTYISHKNRTLFYVCGPFDYMRTVTITLLNNVPPQHIIKENFSSLPRLVMPRPPDVNEHRVTIHIDNQVYFVNVQYPQTILKAAKAKHIILPYSCEAGRCSSCAATCTSGKIWMAYNEVLTDDEVAKGRVLVCQAFPVGGDVEIVF
jgi:ring-1,2-phenylacetyl-CoA epoxidase subunit PaaE